MFDNGNHQGPGNFLFVILVIYGACREKNSLLCFQITKAQSSLRSPRSLISPFIICVLLCIISELATSTFSIF